MRKEANIIKGASLILYDLNLTLGCHRFYYIAPFPVLDPKCLSIERDNHEMHKQGICIECIEHGYMMGCY